MGQAESVYGPGYVVRPQTAQRSSEVYQRAAN